jgi:BMFP domain-containing protein YqiC
LPDLSKLELRYIVSHGDGVLEDEAVEKAKQEVNEKAKNELPQIAKEIENSFRDLLGSSASI